MQLKNGTKVIVADSEKYLVLTNHGDPIGLDLRIVETGMRDNPPSREQGSDRPGRVIPINTRRSAYSDVDWHQQMKEQSSRELSATIAALCATPDASDIVLFADSKTLGLIRQNMPKTVEDRVIRSSPKDLVNSTIEDIEATVRAL